MAALLDHNVETGKQHYNLMQKNNKVVTAAKFNETIMFSQPLDKYLYMGGGKLNWNF